jgi:DNA-binding CsgD family transcriptional regulator
MALFHRLLESLGLIRAPTVHNFALDIEFEQVLESLAEQQQRSPDEMAADLLSEALSRRRTGDDLWQRWQLLSAREQQVTALTCLDYTNPQIAALLGLSVETVRSYTRNVQHKFNVNSKTALRVQLADWDFSAWHPKR